MKAANCERLTRQPLAGIWYRALRLQNWTTRLSTEHSRFLASRFSNATPGTPSYRVIYLAATHQVAMHEVQALLGDPASPLSNPRSSWVLLSLHVVLDSVVDLSSPAEQHRISTNHAELTGNWLNFPGIAPTQELGDELFKAPDIEGFIYPSSVVNERCLGGFPDKLGPRSSVVFRNEMRRGRLEKLI